MRADIAAAAIDAARAVDAGRYADDLSLAARSALDASRACAIWPQAQASSCCAGRFEGVDQSVLDARNVEEVSIGDYVLSGGELAAQVLIDACVRLLPGVAGNGDFACRGELRRWPPRISALHATARLGGPAPSLTCCSPATTKKIAKWRREQSREDHQERRPDLWKGLRRD